MNQGKHHQYPPIKEAFKQPKSVWAIAFATTISFMGIGLVDPILPAIAHDLGATESQAMLLFTSYLIITAVTMFFTSWVSSRLGLRKTIMIGLVLIIVFAAACSLSSTVNQIIGWRSGWGLGNALFISTALSAIVSAAHGGVAGAIILYESAIGIGMAVGPLAGGLLGSFSWRGPFIGTALLMTIGFCAITFLYKGDNKGNKFKDTSKTLPASQATVKKEAFDLLVAFRALKNPTLGVLSLAALFYNMVFFVLLAYSPFPIEEIGQRAGIKFGELQLGFVFFGWGIGLALTSVGLAPILTRKIGLLTTIKGGLGLAAILMGVMALCTDNLIILVLAVVFSGLIFGILNTAFTEAVMDATDLPRNVASSAYSGVRFLGGAVASAGAGPLAAVSGISAPYIVGLICAGISIILLFWGAKHLAILNRTLHLASESEAQAVSGG